MCVQVVRQSEWDVSSPRVGGNEGVVSARTVDVGGTPIGRFTFVIVPHFLRGPEIGGGPGKVDRARSLLVKEIGVMIKDWLV
jgi:hypothetical protein